MSRTNPKIDNNLEGDNKFGSDKLNNFYNHWKYFHDYLISREFSYGTWAEGFEIGVSSFLSGFNGYDIGWNHEIWSKMIVASGYKNGHKGSVIHGTER
jgi:hypothetical protein